MSAELWTAYTTAMKAWQSDETEANAWRVVRSYRDWLADSAIPAREQDDMIATLVKNLAERTKAAA